ncbi:MAG: hypothetical protein HWE34_06470 [Methylocystaceae bacterium]|nr:hypothetical protein [Methylocystaceae bacterium]
MLSVLSGVVGCNTTDDPHASNATTKTIDPSFLGSGNEPPWTVALYPTKLVLTRGYDKQSITQPIVRYGMSFMSEEYTVSLKPGPCFDSMSGKKFDTTVVVSAEKETLHGCGQELN